MIINVCFKLFASSIDYEQFQYLILQTNNLTQINILFESLKIRDLKSHQSSLKYFHLEKQTFLPCC